MDMKTIIEAREISKLYALGTATVTALHPSWFSFSGENFPAFFGPPAPSNRSQEFRTPVALFRRCGQGAQAPGPGCAGLGQIVPPGRSFAVATFRRRTAARGDCASDRHRSAVDPGRRADRCAGYRDGLGDPAAVDEAQSGGPHHRDGDT